MFCVLKTIRHKIIGRLPSLKTAALGCIGSYKAKSLYRHLCLEHHCWLDVILPGVGSSAKYHLSSSWMPAPTKTPFVTACSEERSFPEAFGFRFLLTIAAGTWQLHPTTLCTAARYYPAKFAGPHEQHKQHEDYTNLLKCTVASQHASLILWENLDGVPWVRAALTLDVVHKEIWKIWDVGQVVWLRFKPSPETESNRLESRISECCVPELKSPAAMSDPLFSKKRPYKMTLRIGKAKTHCLNLATA